jgi:hypothetical protein
MRYAQPPAARAFDACVLAGWAQAWSHLFISIGRRGLDDGRAVVLGLCSARTASEAGKIVAPSVAVASSNWLAVAEASITLAGNQASQAVQSLAMAAPGPTLRATLDSVGQATTDIALATAEALSLQRAALAPFAA